MNQGYGAPPAQNSGLTSPNPKQQPPGAPSVFGSTAKAALWGIFQGASALLVGGVAAAVAFMVIIAVMVAVVVYGFSALNKYALEPIRKDAEQGQQQQQQRYQRPTYLEQPAAAQKPTTTTSAKRQTRNGQR